MNKLFKQAFTLIELLVVIAIIGILSGLIVVSMSGITTKANIAKSQVFSNSLRNSLMSNLLAEWKFEGPTSAGSAITTDDIKDTWGISNGTIYGPAMTVSNDCPNSKCIDFNNTSIANLSRIENIPINLSTSGYLTVSYWVYYRHGYRYNSGVFSDDNYAGIFQITNQGGNVVLYLGVKSTQAEVVLYSNSSNVDNYFSLTENVTNKWKMMTVTYDGSKMRFFEDGKELTPVTTAIGLLRTSDSSTMKIGNLTTYWLDGKMDDIRIYNTPMPAYQIQQKYKIGLEKLLGSGQITSQEYLSRIEEMDKGVAENQ